MNDEERKLFYKTRWVVFYHSVDGRDIFWFCTADTDKEALSEFWKDYQLNQIVMSGQGYWMAQVPPVSFLEKTKDHPVQIIKKAPSGFQP